MVKNCGDSVHFQIAERNVLGEMVKIAKKRVGLFMLLLYYGMGCIDVMSFLISVFFFVCQLILFSSLSITLKELEWTGNIVNFLWRLSYGTV